ncbi:MAG: phasin family protein [Proteobacteria bacterium]|nr:phasin family protein [Pseudomonadota bacterium]
MGKVSEKLRERLPDMDAIREKLKTRKDGLEDKTRDVVLGILERLNLPTRDEVSEIRERLDRLSKEVNTLSRLVKKDKEGEGQS